MVRDTGTFANSLITRLISQIGTPPTANPLRRTEAQKSPTQLLDWPLASITRRPALKGHTNRVVHQDK